MKSENVSWSRDLPLHQSLAFGSEHSLVSIPPVWMLRLIMLPAFLFHYWLVEMKYKSLVSLLALVVDRKRNVALLWAQEVRAGAPVQLQTWSLPLLRAPLSRPIKSRTPCHGALIHWPDVTRSALRLDISNCSWLIFESRLLAPSINLMLCHF